MEEEGTEKPQILVTLGLSSISGQCQHCQIWADSCIYVCISQILGTLGIICIVQGVKTELSWLFFAAVQKRLHKGTTRQWGQREHKELHWNMIVRTNPSCQCANHVGKCKIDPRSLMIAAAIHGKGTRDWDMPLLCPARGQDVPHWSFVKSSTTSTALGCTWWERSRTAIPSGQGRNGTGMSSSKHRAKAGSHRKWE